MRFNAFVGAWVLFASVLLGGCKIEPMAAGVTLTPSPTAGSVLPLSSLLPTLSATSEIATLPTAATPTAHLYLSPNIDSLILKDEFASNENGWQLAVGTQGVTSLSDGEMVMTARASYTTLEAFLPSSIPQDFFAEITMRPILCRADNDSFGLAFRIQGNEEYRLVITCTGQMRFEHNTGGVLIGANLWTKSKSLLPGAPAENRIGVLARGMSFQFFANGAACFSYNDPILKTGKIGLFIRTEKGQLMTVAFDDLSVYSLKAKSP
jgi:hypothetical protein